MPASTASNWAFVIGAYSITWIVIIGYAIHLRRVLRSSREAYDRATGGAAQ